MGEGRTEVLRRIRARVGGNGAAEVQRGDTVGDREDAVDVVGARQRAVEREMLLEDGGAAMMFQMRGAEASELWAAATWRRQSQLVKTMIRAASTAPAIVPRPPAILTPPSTVTVAPAGAKPRTSS